MHDLLQNVSIESCEMPPGFGAHGVHLTAADLALYETMEVMNTLPIGALHFGYEPLTDDDVPASDQLFVS